MEAGIAGQERLGLTQGAFDHVLDDGTDQRREQVRRGGSNEEEAARWVKANMKKPVVGFIAGDCLIGMMKCNYFAFTSERLKNGTKMKKVMSKFMCGGKPPPRYAVVFVYKNTAKICRNIKVTS